jgi:hypothetical protein
VWLQGHKDVAWHIKDASMFGSVGDDIQAYDSGLVLIFRYTNLCVIKIWRSQRPKECNILLAVIGICVYIYIYIYFV